MTHKVNHYQLGGRFTLNGLRLRPADEAECLAWGASPEELIKDSIANSVASYAVVAYEQIPHRGHMIDCPARPLALWGYGSRTPMSDTCYGWLLTFPEIDKFKLRFARASKRVIAFLLEVYTVIEVTVDAEHKESLKWLGWLGFKKTGVVMSPTGAAFYTMQRTR